MKKENISVYIVTSADYNSSAYVGEYFKTRRFLTGFTGSNGTFIVTENEAVLYTDSRYYIQAEKQLASSGIKLYKADEKETEPMHDYICRNTPVGCRAAADGRTVSANFAEKLVSKLEKKNSCFLCDVDLASKVWENSDDERPPMSTAPAYIHDIKYAGTEAAEKIAQVRNEMKKCGADIHLITALDDIAWLLNIRGSDIHCMPAVLSYVIMTADGFILFINENKLNDSLRTYLDSLKITVMPYEAVYTYLEEYDGEAECMLLDSHRVNYRLYKASKQRFKLVDKTNPTTLLKAVKNETEINNARTAHLYDGKALTEFLAYLKSNVGDGKITEVSCGKLLHEYRKKAGARDDSFDAICGYAHHGAIVHYSANEATDIRLEKKGMLLLDSGGQYAEGTTDVTRTVVLGDVTELEKKCYTLVLKGMLALGSMRFKKGMTGSRLDAIARRPLWEHGFDYGHSTGHGVGSYLCVHEAPNGFSFGNETAFEAGMITSDEPGIYVEGKFGVRIENEVLCNDDGDGFLSFEFLTLVPIDKEAVDMSLMTDEDINRLNEYHAYVREKLLPVISDEAREYLLQATEPVKNKGSF